MSNNVWDSIREKEIQNAMKCIHMEEYKEESLGNLFLHRIVFPSLRVFVGAAANGLDDVTPNVDETLALFQIATMNKSAAAKFEVEGITWFL